MNTAPPLTVRELIRRIEQRFNDAGLYFGHGTDNALDEAAWLVGSALQLAPHELDAHLEDRPTPAQQNAIRALVEKRINTRQPLAYLLKEAWFAGLKFYVDERVIVPRSLTAEFIVEQFHPWIDPARIHRILDLCTGSGCMAIACAYAFPEARVEAADISEAALAVARINVENHGQQGRVQLLHSDLFSGLAGARYDLIVTNPPYVARAEMQTLPPEYRHEPALALASGAQGLDAVTRILAAAPSHLNPGGILVAEVGNSAASLQEKFPSAPFTWLTTATGDESVLLLTAEQLRQHHAAFAPTR
ncbi:MAG: 50S ribosomal protein L3 N(5)-glutamine methyltransferase [Sulfuricaulis sp.]|nr:50S ribosomal protein L3 N(5)-glutamine methyltransferase [Sulfuricaulis sp.]